MRAINGFGIFVNAHASTAVAVAIRRGCPARQPSPKNSSASRIAMIASLPSSGDDRELDFAFSDVEQRVSWVSLSEDLATSLVVNDSVSAGDSNEYGFPVDNLVRILHGIRLAAIDGILGHQYLLTSLSIPAGCEECLMCGGCRDGGDETDFRFAHH